MKTVNVSELEGAALDWAVANAVEAWKTAHELFPTWTMDATFSGVRPMVYRDGQALCQLIPNNPMRQDYQVYSPSTDWSQGGPLIEKQAITITDAGSNRDSWSAGFVIWMPDHDDWLTGPTPLIAACRAIVDKSFGSTVDVPEELF